MKQEPGYLDLLLFLSPLLAKLCTVVLLVPLTEGSGINLNRAAMRNVHRSPTYLLYLDDAVLHQSVGGNHLVVGGVVNNVQKTSFAGNDCGRLLETYSFHCCQFSPSEPQEKLPTSRRKARNFVCPPRTRTSCTRLGPIRVHAWIREQGYVSWLLRCLDNTTFRGNRCGRCGV